MRIILTIDELPKFNVMLDYEFMVNDVFSTTDGDFIVYNKEVKGETITIRAKRL